MPDRDAPHPHGLHHHTADARSLFGGQFAFIVRNVVGWLMILTTPGVGALPGPGGVIWFIIGFALVSFPGKRKITSSMMRGRPMRVRTFPLVVGIIVVSVALGLAGLWYFWTHLDELQRWLRMDDPFNAGEQVAMVASIVLLSVALSWVTMRLGVVGVNVFIRGLPIARRWARPWLRRKGIFLLPPRRVRQKGGAWAAVNDNEILDFSHGQRDRARTAGKWFVTWAKRAAVIGLTLWLVVRVVRPVVNDWPVAQQALGELELHRFVLSTLLFALFLFACRAVAWRAIVAGFGKPVPLAPATRVWITSELARYVPGVIWQVVGRVALLKPYGVRGSVTSTSQVLELVLFLLANAMLAVACLCWFGVRALGQGWFVAALALTPLLAVAVHPRVFYGIADAILRKLGKPAVQNRLRGRQMLALLAWYGAGLLVQSVAVYLLVGEVLGVRPEKWWTLAGSYALAWMAGFLAFWAPGGMGMREFVLVAALGVALPKGAGPADASTLGALAIVLRGWTILAELLVAACAYAADWRGAVGDPDAPGRVGLPAPTTRGDVAHVPAVMASDG